MNGRLATSLYSVLENLYLSVVKNLGLTSTMNPFTSSTIGCRCSSVYYVARTISLFQTLIFLMLLAARIRVAAASSLPLYLRRDESKRAISIKYWAKKNTFSSEATVVESLLNLSRNL